MPARQRILVVDDEAELRDLLVGYLGEHGFEVEGCAGGAELDRRLAAAPAELVLLDLGLPGEDGFSIARRLRGLPGGGPAIIMVTGAGTVVDRVVGLEVGADDYVPKPFDYRELLARIRAVLRRASAKAAPKAGADEVVFGPWRLDLGARTLTRDDGGAVVLTAMEFDLLAALAKRPNRVLTRDQLLDLSTSGAASAAAEPFDRAIDVRVTRLRRKVEADPGRPRFIRTVRGTGYMFTPNGSE
ncbi:MAG TPA: response regulator [Azospirillaceae bacterium]|nr:response regulator [Azospirillaceae bacterium]